METQRELERNADTLFSDRYPVWKCPNCGWLNRYTDTFLEICVRCKANYTLDWETYVIK